MMIPVIKHLADILKPANFMQQVKEHVFFSKISVCLPRFPIFSLPISMHLYRKDMFQITLFRTGNTDLLMRILFLVDLRCWTHRDDADHLVDS